MIDEKKMAQNNVEMTIHVNGIIQYLNSLSGGRFVTQNQARDMADYVLVQTKRDIESCPFVY